MKKFVLLFLCLAFSVSFAFGQESGGVKGKVRNAEGSSLAGVSVTARQNTKDVKSVTTDSSGEFVLVGLPAGDYTIVLEKEGYALAIIYNVQIPKNKIREFDKKLVLKADRGDQVIFKGSVFNQDGFSLSGVKVRIERISTGTEARKLGDEYTDRSGEFTFTFSKITGTFRITATAKGVSASKEVSVSDAAIYRVALTLNLPKEN
jgi:hypothetical protein